MTANSEFDKIIGQESLKSTLSIYRDAFKRTGRLPFLNFIAARGSGKTFVVKTFWETLRRKDGERPPLLEVNAATVPNVEAFFDRVFPVWTHKKAVLFFDEAHNLKSDLQEIFLTALNVEKAAVRRVDINGRIYTFDFRDISIIFATTDQQKMGEAFRSRLKDLSFNCYSPNELFEIFLLNKDDSIFIQDSAKEDIISTFRGEPRDAVKKAEDLFYFCQAKSNFNVNFKLWQDFKASMGINPYGLEHAEIQVLKAIGDRGFTSLTNIAAATDYSRGVIQRVYEPMLTKKRLLEIGQKRSLTNEGLKLYHKLSRKSA